MMLIPGDRLRMIRLAALLLVGVALHAGDPELRTQIKHALFADDPLPALKPETHGTFEPEPGVIAERISYGTQFGMRVPAILYRPKSVGLRAPAIIIVNGHGGDKYSWYPVYAGILYARGGAFVLTYDPTGEGERNSSHKSGTRAHDKVEPIPELGQRLGGLMLTDVRQAVSYLSQRSEVDPGRIAAVGYSMGSFVLGIACAVETRLKACVLVGGGNLDGPGGYWDGSKPMCQGYPYQSLQFLGDRPVALYSLHASRGPTLVYNGLEDTTVAIPRFGEPYFRELQDRVAKARGKRDGVFDAMFNPGTAHRPYFVTKPVALWLNQHLSFPNWTAKEIEAMPLTRISDWAKVNAMEMDPLYSTEQREGGTPGLGTGIPGIKRGDLDVFTQEQWVARQQLLVHEAWRERAKALIK